MFHFRLHSRSGLYRYLGRVGEKSGKNILYMNFVQEKVLQCALDAVNSMRRCV